MIKPPMKLLSAAVAFALIAPSVTYATNGYFMIGAGSKSRGMGGTGIARGQDSLAAAANPAAAIDIDSRVDIHAEFFRAKVSVAHNSSFMPAYENSDRDLFLIPNLGFSYRASENMVYNFAMFGSGSETNYDQDPDTYQNQGCPSTYFFNVSCGARRQVGVNLIQVHMLPGVAFKMNENHTVGLSLDLVAQRFRARGLQSFVTLGYSGNGDRLTDRGFDMSYGGGIRLGWQGNFDNEKLKLGAYYASRGHMTKFKEYSGLFAEGGGFDIPPHFGVGINAKVTPKMNVAFDLMRIQYNEVDAVGNPGPNVVDTTDFNPLCPGADTDACKTGGELGMGFGWTNQTIYKFGFDYQVTPALVTRFGYNYAKSPVKENEVLFNMLAPAVVEKHFTFGATYDWDKETEISFNFMHAFSKTLHGKSPFYPAGVTNYEDLQNGNVALAMKQTSLGLMYSIKF